MIIVTGCVIVLPFYVIETVIYKPVPLSATAIYAITAMSLVSTVLGTLMWNRGNQLIGPSRAGMFINLIPVFAAIMAIVFLDESLHLYHVICAVLIRHRHIHGIKIKKSMAGQTRYLIRN